MNYPNAPITEAIFDIRFDELENPSLESIKAMQDLIKENYPEANKRINISGKLKFDHKSETFSHDDKADPFGFIFMSPDKTRQVQARLDGFTFNLLAPYSDWQNFSQLAFETWDIFQDIVKPKNIIRIALRYINKINIPISGFKDFDDYFTCMPKIPSVLPQTFANFFVQTIVPFNAEGQVVAITQTMEPTREGYLPFLLDIDVFQSGIHDKRQLKQYFEVLRDIKNVTFEACITNNTRQLFL